MKTNMIPDLTVNQRHATNVIRVFFCCRACVCVCVC